jgi:hypothetical protein
MDGKIVSLADHKKQKRQQRAVIHRTARRLREIEDELADLVVNLAIIAGPLAAWAEEQPVGTKAQINDEMLEKTGDAQVLALLRLKERVYATVEELYGIRHP